jgi:hypothetical protein
MIKLVWISDKDIRGIAFWFLKKVSKTNVLNDVKGVEAEELIKSESADFLFFNIKKPANSDIMERLCIRNYTSLRVSIFTIKPSKSRILRFFFPPELIKTIIQNISIGSRTSPGKFISSR